MNKHFVHAIWAVIVLSLVAELAACSSTSPASAPSPKLSRATSTLQPTAIALATTPVPAMTATTSTEATSSLLNSAKTTTTPFPTIAAPDAENVPLHPSAKNVDNIDIYGHAWWYASYESDTPQEELVTFYKEQLPKKGWKLAAESVQKEIDNPPLGWKPDIGMRWEWSGSTLSTPLPWNLTLIVSVIHDQQWRHRIVRLTLDRVPNMTRIPLYRDAQQVERKELPSDIAPARFTDIHIWYVTDATPEELRTFYLNNLPQHGWKRVEESPRLVYKWSEGDLHHRRWAGITITADIGSDGGTRVHMKFEGTYEIIRQVEGIPLGSQPSFISQTRLAEPCCFVVPTRLIGSYSAKERMLQVSCAGRE
jgi:hypothetical protein